MLLNQQLWSVYQMASNRESIRALLLYDFEEEDTDLGYKFIVICTDPASFFIDLNWVNEIDPVGHIEKERFFYQSSHIYFNCCIIFKTAWSSQFIFIKNDEKSYFFKQSKIIVFIDRDFLIKSERIRIEAMNFGQWKEPPIEVELRALVSDFYEEILQICRLIKQQPFYFTLSSPEFCIEWTIVHFVQWLSYFGVCFSVEELQDINALINSPSKVTEVISFKQLSKYIQLATHLLELYCDYTNYNYQTPQIVLLKEYIDIILRQENVRSEGYKMSLVRVN